MKQALENLKSEDKEELKQIYIELQTYLKSNENDFLVKDNNLKIRIARICLKLIQETPKNKKAITGTSYVITGEFIWYKYGDQLDKAVTLAAELELPEQHVSGDVIKMWEEMKKIFYDYIT